MAVSLPTAEPALPPGPFRTTELTTYGLTVGRLRGLLRTGEVRRVLHGVYVAADCPDTIDVRAAAVATVAPAGHVVVDRTAAWLHGVDCHSAAELEVGVALETCALRGSRATRLTGVRGLTRDLVPADVMTLGDIRVTTPLRTASDLGRFLRRREAYAAICGLSRAHEVTAHDLCAQLVRFAGQRGVIQLRTLAPLADGRFESAREAWTFLAIHDAGLPHPEPQVWVERSGVETYRLDFAYRRARVYVEYDGDEGHSTPGQRERDEARRSWLRDQGWTAIVLRSGDFTGERLERWLDRLRTALAAPYSSRRW
jgi:hypothetical protein